MEERLQALRLLDLEGPAPDHPDRFTGPQPPRSFLAKVYGGQLFGQTLAAMARTVGPDRLPHVLQISCFAAGEHHVPITYDVDRLRDGRSFSFRSTTASQPGRDLVHASATFHVDEPGLQHRMPTPTAPAPETQPLLADVIRDHTPMDDTGWRDEWPGLEVRYVEEHLTGNTPGQPGRQQVWMRLRHPARPADPLPDDPTLHRVLLAYLSDLTSINSSLLPHGIVIGAEELPRSTLNHSLWMHEDVRVDEWLLFDQTSMWAGGGRALVRAEVHNRGRHVASLAQEGLIRPVGALRARLGLDGPPVDAAATDRTGARA